MFFEGFRDARLIESIAGTVAALRESVESGPATGPSAPGCRPRMCLTALPQVPERTHDRVFGNHTCRTNRHQPLRKQQATLAQKLRGHCEYYGTTGNSIALGRFRTGLLRAWCQWLDRRSHHARMNWERFNRLLARYPIPPVIATHSLFRHAAKP